MIWLAVLILAVVALAPLAAPLWRKTALRGGRRSAMELHQAQLAELDRDLSEGRIVAAEHATAVLEVQRRLLSAAASEDAAPRPSSAGPLVAAVVVIPLAAVALYLVNGRPDLPAAPLAARMAAADARAADAAPLVQQLRETLSALDPHSDSARQGFELLGNILSSEGDNRGASDAWHRALAVRFDPLLAARTADAASRADGRLTEDSVTLFRRALAAAPPDAPWREAVEQRLATRTP